MFELTHLLHTELRGPNCVVFAEDGEAIAAGADDGTLLLWHPALDAILEIQVGSPVVCLSAIPWKIGNFDLMCGLGDGLLLEIRLNGSQDTTPDIQDNVAHIGPVTAIVHSRKLNIMLSAGQDDGIKSWKRDSNERWCKRGDLVDPSPRATEPIQSMSLTSADDGLIITYVGGTTLILDLSNGSILRKIESNAPIAASAVDISKSLFAYATFQGCLEVRTLYSNSLHASVQLPVGQNVATSAMAFLSPNMLLSASPRGDAVIWRFLEDHLRPEMLNHEGAAVRSMDVSLVGVSASHRLLFVTLSRNENDNTSLRLWNWNEGPSSMKKTRIRYHKSGLITNSSGVVRLIKGRGKRKRMGYLKTWTLNGTATALLIAFLSLSSSIIFLFPREGPLSSSLYEIYQNLGSLGFAVLR
ncbi:WD40 repeat-like protein [Sistotremastrum suecicum HHB10207 ss-3]|uniref:WD40 repeat-like protein n=1 Tax=Sistotremastrum suecicum HHB10207 ss-3 TaxID=1314776 RepID=A0A165X9P9_9AGAM|nr:WD40 repeat-like protein [Sistotremastrum suecicum HHB10207 ss-3]